MLRSAVIEFVSSLLVSNSQREFELNQAPFILISVAHISEEERSLQIFNNYTSSKLDCILGLHSVMVLTDLYKHCNVMPTLEEFCT